MSELISDHPSRQAGLFQHRRRRLPKAVRGDPAEARAVQRRSNLPSGVLGVTRTTERAGNHRILKLSSGMVTDRVHRVDAEPQRAQADGDAIAGLAGSRLDGQAG